MRREHTSEASPAFVRLPMLAGRRGGRTLGSRWRQVKWCVSRCRAVAGGQVEPGNRKLVHCARLMSKLSLIVAHTLWETQFFFRPLIALRLRSQSIRFYAENPPPGHNAVLFRSFAHALQARNNFTSWYLGTENIACWPAFDAPPTC